MSTASSDVLLSTSDGKEKSVLWLDTFYFSLIPHNILNMNLNIIWTSEKIRPKYVDMIIEFQFVRISELEFRLTCIRTPVCLMANEYTLQLHCSINVFDRDPVVLTLQSNELMVFQKLFLDASYRENWKSSELNKIFELKVLIKMIEYDCARSRDCAHQEEEFRKIKEKYFGFEPTLTNLCNLLHIPRLENIFTGRQSDEFARLKTLYICRTASFSCRITDYIRAKEACISVPVIDLGIVLNSIVNGEHKPISDTNLFEVYFEAYRMGLNYLVDLSRDAISGRLGNQNFMIEALQVADCLNDSLLFEKVAEKFYARDGEFSNAEVLERLKSSGMKWRFLAISLERRLKKREAGSTFETGESSQSSTLTLTSLK